jgi:hypothetical protein
LIFRAATDGATGAAIATVELPPVMLNESLRVTFGRRGAGITVAAAAAADAAPDGNPACKCGTVSSAAEAAVVMAPMTDFVRVSTEALLSPLCSRFEPRRPLPEAMLAAEPDCGPCLDEAGEGVAAISTSAAAAGEDVDEGATEEEEEAAAAAEA